MSKRRVIAVGVGVGVGVALAVALALWWSAGEARDVAPAQPLALGGEVERSPAPLTAPGASSDRRVEVESAPSSAAQRIATTAISTREATDDSVLLTGSVVVRDLAGAAHARESGSLELELRYSVHGAEIEAVEVVEGRYETRVPRDVLLGVGLAELGERQALADPPFEPVPVPADGVFDVELRWLSPMLLHVRSRVDGRELDGCTIVYADNVYGSDHPGPFAEDVATDVLREGVASPVELELAPGPRGGRIRSLFVRAAGHAWRRIEVDVVVGGERTVELDPGGSLFVVARGVDPSDPPFVVLRRPPEERGYLYGSVADGSASFEAIAAGRYDVLVVTDSELVLARSQVDVVASQRARLELDLDETPPSLPGVSLAGTLVMPPEWRPDAVGQAPSLDVERLEVEPGDDLWLEPEVSPIEGRPRAFAWRVEVHPGRFWISTGREWGLVVDVGPAGREDVLLEVPSEVEVVVRVVDVVTERPVHPRSVRWMPAVPDDVGHWIVVEADEPGRYVFAAPPGSITVGLRDADFVSDSRVLEVGSGTNEVTLEARPACGFLLFLRDGAMSLPIDSRWWPKAVEVGGDGRSTWYPDHPTGRRVQVSKPGLYRFEMPRIDGYAPIPAQVVLVSPGAYAEHVIELVRSP